VEHVLDDADQFVAVTWLLFDQCEQQQLEVAVAEHAATTTPATAAHFVPVGEEIAAAVATTEGAGMAFVMFVGIPAFAVPESVAVMVMVLM